MKRLSIRLSLLLLVSTILVAAPFPSLAAGLSLQGVNLQRAGNLGPVSMIVSGSGFTAQTQFDLIDSGNRHFIATKRIFINDSKMLATFNLLGAATGNSRITATDASGSVSRDNILVVVAGTGGKLDVQIQTQDSFQAGKPGLVQVSYANTGDTDMPIPLLVLNVPEATVLNTSQGGSNFGSSALILGIPNAPLNTMLRPQERVTIPFYAIMPSTGAGMATVTPLDPGSSKVASVPLNYSGAISNLPNPASPLVQTVVTELKSEYGETMGSFYSAELNRVQELVDQGATEYQTIRHINGEWQLQSATPQPGAIRPPVFDLDEKLNIPSVDPVPVQNSGDGLRKTYAVLIGINEYEREGADLDGTVTDVNNFFQFLHYEMRVPDRQITRVMGNIGGPLITKEIIRDAILNCGADGDDNLIIYYSGHGTLRKSESDNTEVGAWCMGGKDSYLAGPEISALISKKNAGQTYLFSDSCHSGALLNDVKAVRTAIFAASKRDEISSEGFGDNGGFFSAVLLHYLRKGMSLNEAIDKTAKYTGYAGADQHPEYYPDGVNMVFPFGAMGTNAQSHSLTLDQSLGWIAQLLETGKGAFRPPAVLLVQWSGEADELGLTGVDKMIYIQNKNAEWTEQQGLGSGGKSRGFNITEAVDTAPADYVPGGLAVSPARRIFYVSDNTNGRILMLNPAESQHRKITLLSGLQRAGSLKVSDNGRALVYTTDNRVKKLFFGFTAYIADAQGHPLSGAVVNVRSDFGDRTVQVPADGYLTVLDLQKPSLSDRSINLTVQNQGASQLFPFTLLDGDHTFVSLTFSGSSGVIVDPLYPVGAEP